MSPGPGWHDVYRNSVLMPDFRFATQHLAHYFLDAMTAHVRTVRRLSDPSVTAHRGDIERLEGALAQLRAAPLPSYSAEVPDLYFAFNKALEAQLGRGPVSFLRLGLSRNDLDMTVYKMRTRELLLTILERIVRLRAVLLDLSEEHVETLFIAHTHHQPGQPTTVAHYLSAVEAALARDVARLRGAYDRLNTCPLGAAALAGSSHPLDRAYTAELLGFDGPVANTYDAVASSDWQVEFVAGLQSVALLLSRFVCDLLVWASQGLVRLPDGLVQGSSIMPQKRNPVALEHARTRFSRTLGSAQMVLYSSHNIPFGDLNDFGPDIQGALVTCFIQIDGGLALLTTCLEEGSFERERLAQTVAGTDTTATELADELARSHDLSFQEAHGLAADLVSKLAAEGRGLLQATPEDLVAVGGPRLAPAVLREALDPQTFVTRRRGLGGPAPEAMRPFLQAARRKLDAAAIDIEALRSVLHRVRADLAAQRKENA